MCRFSQKQDPHLPLLQAILPDYSEQTLAKERSQHSPSETALQKAIPIVVQTWDGSRRFESVFLAVVLCCP